ncbi:hypothetical protein BHMPCIPO_00041 [Ensifer sesbaniae]|nr:hypothetical protein [Ensifer sesbaniae]
MTRRVRARAGCPLHPKRLTLPAALRMVVSMRQGVARGPRRRRSPWELSLLTKMSRRTRMSVAQCVASRLVGPRGCVNRRTPHSAQNGTHNAGTAIASILPR